MLIRTIGLWQPWASAVALGLKRFETRHWCAGYRGPLAIYATQHIDRAFAAAMHQAGYLPAPNTLPLGAVLCIGDLADDSPTESLDPSPLEKMFGNWEPGRRAWELDNVRAFPTPIHSKGRQRWWTVDIPDHLIEAAVPVTPVTWVDFHSIF